MRSAALLAQDAAGRPRAERPGRAQRDELAVAVTRSMSGRTPSAASSVRRRRARRCRARAARRGCRSAPRAARARSRRVQAVGGNIGSPTRVAELEEPLQVAGTRRRDRRACPTRWLPWPGNRNATLGRLRCASSGARRHAGAGAFPPRRRASLARRSSSVARHDAPPAPRPAPVDADRATIAQPQHARRRRAARASAADPACASAASRRRGRGTARPATSTPACVAASPSCAASTAWKFVPPKPNALTAAARRSAGQGRAVRGQGERARPRRPSPGSAPSMLSVGGSTPWCSASAALIESGEPGRALGVADLRLDRAERARCPARAPARAKTSVSVSSSVRSPTTVPVPCASTRPTSAGDTPACRVGALERAHLALRARRREPEALAVARAADALTTA